MNFIKKLFSMRADTLRSKQLERAQLDLLDHIALAEYHNAMAQMLQGRIERLQA